MAASIASIALAYSPVGCSKNGVSLTGTFSHCVAFACAPHGSALAYGVRKKSSFIAPGTYSSARFARLEAVPGYFQSRLAALDGAPRENSS